MPSQAGALQSNSPLGLTDNGKQIARFIDTEGLAKTIVPLLRNEVRGNAPFEADEICQQYVQTRLTPEQERQVSEGAYRIGTDPITAKRVLAIVLREELV